MSMKSAMRMAGALLLCTLAGLAEDRPNPHGPASSRDGVFYIIPHTHWEGAVFKTREEYLELGLTHILTAVRLLKEHPEYRFALDQMAYFRPFVERYPEEAGAFRKFVQEGRLQIVGGLNVMPDDNMPSGESFIRQMLYTKTYCREALGTDVKTAWFIDTFGHHAQMPQLLRLGGFETFWFSRGVESRSAMRSEYLWEGIDGTTIKTFWLPLMYANFASPPHEFAKFKSYAKGRYDELAPYVRDNPLRVGFQGADVTDPDVRLPALFDQFNAESGRPFRIQFAVPREIEAAFKSQTNLPVVTGERNPLFQGVYSSRIELKQRMREMERLLTAAEKLDALGNWLGKTADPRAVEQAWDCVTFNVTHDLASGVMTDDVYEDTVRSYDFAHRLATGQIEQQLNSILEQVHTAGDGIALAVFNPLGWPRTDVALGDAGFAESGITDFNLVGPDGTTLPAQLTEEERFDDGGLRRIKFAFVAREVPALGYSIYHVIPRKERGADNKRPSESASGACENARYRAAFDLKTGALTSLQLKEDGVELLAGPANVVAVEPDHGDVWELYRNLDGAQTLIMTRPLGVPQPGHALFSTQATSTNGVIRHGPVFAELNVKQALGTNLLEIKARIYEALPRIDFETRILNRDKFVRYRALFPTTITNDSSTQEIPFGVIQRRTSQEFPAQNWIDYSDASRGLSLLNRGNPGNNVAAGTLMLSLLRSTRIQSYGIGGGFEGQSSDSALELNREITLRYALLPHRGNWQEAETYRTGLEFNNPLIVRKAPSHAGQLPATWGVLNVSAPNVIVSAFKPSRDGTAVVRFYEAAGKPAPGVTIRFNTKLAEAFESSLLEDTQGKLDQVQDTIRLDFHPFQIRTVKLRLER